MREAAQRRLYSQARSASTWSLRGTQHELQVCFISISKQVADPAPATGEAWGCGHRLCKAAALVAKESCLKKMQVPAVRTGMHRHEARVPEQIKSFWELWAEHQALAGNCLFCDASLDALGWQSPIHSFCPDLSPPHPSLQRCLEQDF